MDKVLAWAGCAIVALLVGFFLGHYGVLDDTGALVLFAGGLLLAGVAGPTALKRD